MNETGYYTVAELAARLAVHPHWVYRRVTLNLIPHHKLGDGKRAILRFKKQDIHEWEDAQRMDGEGPLTAARTRITR